MTDWWPTSPTPPDQGDQAPWTLPEDELWADQPVPAPSETAEFSWGADAAVMPLQTDDLVKVRKIRPRTVIAALLGLAVVAGLSAWVLSRPTGTVDLPPASASPTTGAALQLAQLDTTREIAPGFSAEPAWSWTVPSGVKVAGTGVGLVSVSSSELKLTSTTGTELFRAKIADPIDSIASGQVDSHDSLVWLSGKSLEWWSDGDPQVHRIRRGWVTELSNAGGGVLATGDGRAAVLRGGALAEVQLAGGELALGDTAEGVVVASAAGLALDSPGGTRTSITLRPPDSLNTRPVRWAGLSANYVVVVWAATSSPSASAQVKVTLHRLDGSAADSVTMSYSAAVAATWMRTMGQRAGTFSTASWDLGTGRVLADCGTSCILEGGFGPLVSAASGGQSGFVVGNTLYPSSLTVLGYADSALLVRAGRVVSWYPAVN